MIVGDCSIPSFAVDADLDVMDEIVLDHIAAMIFDADSLVPALEDLIALDECAIGEDVDAAPEGVVDS